MTVYIILKHTLDVPTVYFKSCAVIQLDIPESKKQLNWPFPQDHYNNQMEFLTQCMQGH